MRSPFYSIYLDNNATTATEPQAISAMLEELHYLGNPSSAHRWGQKASARLWLYRKRVAEVFGVSAEEITFTSSGTEALNTLLLAQEKGHILSSAIEHSCVLAPLQKLQERGCNLTLLAPGINGHFSLKEIEESILPETELLVFSAANSETGVIHDLAGIGDIALRHQLPLIVDGVALPGKTPCHIPAGVSAMVFSGHKFHAPPGVGCFWLKKGWRREPLIFGGGQELGKRSGTENLPAIAAFTRALEIAAQLQPTAELRMSQLRNEFEERICRALSVARVNGKDPRLCNTSNISYLGVHGRVLLLQLDLHGIATSYGSACASKGLQPSHVLQGMQLGEERVLCAVRFSLSRHTTFEEIESTANLVVELVEHNIVNHLGRVIPL